MALELLKPEDDEDEVGGEDRGTDRGKDEPREQVQRDDDQDEGTREDQQKEPEEREDEDLDTEDEPPQRRPTEDENRELRERIARLEGQLSAPDFSRQEPPKEREPSADEKATWTTEKHIEYALAQSEKRSAGLLQNIQFQTLEAGDKAGWAGYCAGDQRARRMTNEVETRLAQYRKQGQWGWSRGDVYTRLVGEKVIQQGRKAADTQRQEGKQRIERQKARGNSPAGDQRRQERPQLSGKDARDKRLREGGFFSS
jgi:hypothetical protein